MMATGWLYLLACSLLLINIQVEAEMYVKVTVLESAISKGAVCLDGSPAAYSYFKGSGDGISNWIVYLEGGGWCFSAKDCVKKSQRKSGHSYDLKGQLFSGILDEDCSFNPDFCHWHKVFIHYCDGSSFSSNIERVDPMTKITYRGARIYNATIEEMLAKGLGDAQNAILAGSSAGGLAAILHCDGFRALFSSSRRVKCIADSGFFIRGDKKGVPGIENREIGFARNVVKTHELANTLPTSCTSKRDAYLCLFPEYLVDDIQTPLFIVESAFDQYQIQNNLLPAVVPQPEIESCTSNIKLCLQNKTISSAVKGFREAFIETLKKVKKSSNRGMFVHSCYIHVHIVGRAGWTCSSVNNNVLGKKTIGEAVSDWYFDRSSFYEIDTKTDTPFICDTPDPNFNQKCLDIKHHSAVNPEL